MDSYCHSLDHSLLLLLPATWNILSFGGTILTESPSKHDVSKDAESDTEVESDEGEDPPDSPTEVKESIKSKFLVEMPEDFYHFWEFAKSANAGNPSSKNMDVKYAVFP